MTTEQELEHLRGVVDQVRAYWKELAQTATFACGPLDPSRVSARLCASQKLCQIVGDSEDEWAELSMVSFRRRNELAELTEKLKAYRSLL